MNPSLLGYGAAVLSELTADERRVVADELGALDPLPRAEHLGDLISQRTWGDHGGLGTGGRGGQCHSRPSQARRDHPLL